MNLPKMTLLMVLAMVLSGCASTETNHDDPANDADTIPNGEVSSGENDAPNTPEDHPHSETNQTPEVDPTPTNTAPLANLTITGQTQRMITVTAPATITFDINGTDIDGDNLTWTIVAGEFTSNGTKLPAQVSIEFTSATTLNATLTVNDGELSNATSIRVTVEAAPQMIAEFYGQGPLLPDPQWAGSAYACLAAHPVQDVRCHVFEVSADLSGRAALVEQTYNVTLISFHETCEPTSLWLGYEGGRDYEPFTIPNGTGCMVVVGTYVTWDWITETDSITIRVYE